MYSTVVASRCSYHPLHLATCLEEDTDNINLNCGYRCCLVVCDSGQFDIHYSLYDNLFVVCQISALPRALLPDQALALSWGMRPCCYLPTCDISGKMLYVNEEMRLDDSHYLYKIS